MNSDNLKKIESLKIELDQLRPLKPEHVIGLKRYFKIGLTYTSNALEGNSLTEVETKVVIEDGITVGGKPLRDHLEAVGHGEAYEFMFSLSGERKVTEKQILELHRIFYWRIDDAQAGKYRTVPVFLSGSHYIPPAAAKVPSRMHSFARSIPAKRKSLHPVDFAAWLHFQIAAIHPFVDGNGRTARLAMNVALLQDGYPVVIIPPAMRREYIDALEKCHSLKGDPAPLFDFIGGMVIESLKDYVRLLRSD